MDNEMQDVALTLAGGRLACHSFGHPCFSLIHGLIVKECHLGGGRNGTACRNEFCNQNDRYG